MPTWVEHVSLFCKARIFFSLSVSLKSHKDTSVCCFHSACKTIITKVYSFYHTQFLQFCLPNVDMLKRFRTFKKCHINPAFLYVWIIKPKAHFLPFAFQNEGKMPCFILNVRIKDFSNFYSDRFLPNFLYISFFKPYPHRYYTWKLQRAVTICWLIDTFLLDTVWLLPSRSWFWHELMDLAIKKEMTVLCVCCFEKEVLSRPFETLHHPCRHFHSYHSIAKHI